MREEGEVTADSRGDALEFDGGGGGVRGGAGGAGEGGATRFGCEYDCGYEGGFEQVAEHEKTCTVRSAAASNSLAISSSRSSKVPT
jgi:hypothetical protein